MIRILKQHAAGEKIIRVLESLPHMSPTNQKIEDVRKRLLARDEPISDGTLGQAGLYDEGISVKRCAEVSNQREFCDFLYLLVRAFRPIHVIELGTDVGITAGYLAAALLDNADGGKLVTLECSPYRLKIARAWHKELGLDRDITYVDGLFDDTLPDVLDARQLIHFAFIDGNHRYEPTVRYFEMLKEASAPYAVFVFDDIRHSKEMAAAWQEILAEEEVVFAAKVTLGDRLPWGCCLVNTSTQKGTAS